MSATLLRAALVTQKRACPAEWVNDVHSGLNPTKVRKIVVPSSEEELADAVNDARSDERPICVSGSRHSMGGQQFARDETLLDLRGLRRVLNFDRHHGIIEVESGIQWPDLMSACLRLQPDTARPWTIRQKQTGADDFTVGGSLSSNIHGRGLAMKPLIDDVESFTLINSTGESICCSRHQNRDLFRLAIGGYGLFGVISRVRLRLQRRRKLRRLVQVIESEALTAAFVKRVQAGCLYGDFQFSIDEGSPHFLRRGVFSCYQPVDDDSPISVQRQLSSGDWLNLLHLAHTDRAEGFRRYTAHYLASHGQTYWSDRHQLSPYLPDYSQRLRGDRGSGALVKKVPPGASTSYTWL